MNGLYRGDTLTSRETAAPAQYLVSPSRNCAGTIDSLASQRPSELIDDVKKRWCVELIFLLPKFFMVDYIEYNVCFEPPTCCYLYIPLSTKSLLATRFDDLESTAEPSRYNVLGSRKSTAEQARDAQLINGPMAWLLLGFREHTG